MCDTQENNLPYNRVATVREKSGNLKINGKQTSENLFCSRGKKMYFLMRKYKPIFLLTEGYS